MKKTNNSGKAVRVTLNITYTAILIAINVALKFLSIPMGVTKLSFAYIPCYIAGMFLGPLQGLLVGALGDLIGTALQGFAPAPWITVGNALLGFIPGLIFMLKKKYKRIHPFILLTVSLIITFFAVTMGISTYGNWLLVGKDAFTAVWLTRITTQPIVVSINAAILFGLYYPLKLIVFDRMGSNVVTADEQVALEPPQLAESAEIISKAIANENVSDEVNTTEKTSYKHCADNADFFER